MNSERHAESLLLIVLGSAGLAAGAFAFVLPELFFQVFAAHTGAANMHLARDVGAAYVSVGAALAWAGLRAGWRTPLLTISGLFLLLHAVGHVLDLATGRVQPGHLPVDAIQVFVPALLVCALAGRSMRLDAAARN